MRYSIEPRDYTEYILKDMDFYRLLKILAHTQLKLLKT